MSSDNSAIIEIIPTEGQVLPAVRLGNALTSLVEALNPLGAIGKAIVDILAYRAEVKRLDVERERICKQVITIEKALQVNLNRDIARIDLQRQAIFDCFQFAEAVLHERRPVRDAYIQSLQQAIAQMGRLHSRPQFPPIEVFQVYQQTIAIISGSLMQLEQLGTAEITVLSKDLRQVVQDFRSELHMIEPVRNNLLPPRR